MQLKIRAITAALCLLSCMFLAAPPALANSAEPPRIIVIVSSPPEDLTLSLSFEDGNTANGVELMKDQTAWEAQYRFFNHMTVAGFALLEKATLIASSGGQTYSYPLAEHITSEYSNILSLDFAKQTITNGQTVGRTVSLVTMRVLLTLLIEGVIFFLFGYRKMRSWIVFVVINLLTQGALNIALNASFTDSYLIMTLFLLELLVLVVELIFFLPLIKEHRKWRTAAYVVSANLCSLFLGGYLILNLPV